MQPYLMCSYVFLCGEFFERRTAVRPYLLLFSAFYTCVLCGVFSALTLTSASIDHWSLIIEICVRPALPLC